MGVEAETPTSSHHADDVAIAVRIAACLREIEGPRRPEALHCRVLHRLAVLSRRFPAAVDRTPAFLVRLPGVLIGVLRAPSLAGEAWSQPMNELRCRWRPRWAKPPGACLISG